jgi:limonene 1,2-monooxygenase
MSVWGFLSRVAESSFELWFGQLDCKGASMAKLRFGYFIAPFHRAGTNPTLALQRDLEFIEHLDTLGFDEVWLGEHHSAGSEIISSPEIFIAAAAERAKRIRFGTGVISLAYHNPLWVADRLMLLDHLTHGRVIGGVGPGSLPTDSSMIGLTPTDTRELLETNLDIVVRLLAGETVNAKTATHQLFDAQLQLAPYSEDGIPLAVAAVASPTGARLAGKHGIGLLSIGATLIIEGFDALAYHWGIVEERAAAFGTQVDRKNWSLVGPMHIAETDEQARADVKFGIEPWFRYFQKVAAFPQMTMPGEQLDEMIDIINDNGAGVIGTPERARAQVQRLWDQSGGFGCFLQMGHEWANPAATKRSAELFAAEVMPHFQGLAQPTLDAAARAGQVRDDLARTQLQAIEHMTKKYESEKRPTNTA